MPGFNIGLSRSCHDDNAFVENVRYDGPSNTREAARAHRYKLEIMRGFSDDSSLLFYLSKCSRPTIEIDEITIHNAQDEIYRPGKNRWQPIKATFYEVLDDSDGTPRINAMASRWFKMWAEKTIILSSSRIGSTRGTSNNSEYYTDIQLDMLNGVGSPIWTYELYRCWPTQVSPQDLSYADSAILETTVTIRFDKAYERVLS